MNDDKLITIHADVLYEVFEPYLEDLDSLADLSFDDIAIVFLEMSSRFNRVDIDTVSEISKEITIKTLNNCIDLGYFDYEDLELLLVELFESIIPHYQRIFRLKDRNEHWLFYTWVPGAAVLKRVRI